MRLWEWTRIKFGDLRTDEQRAADKKLKAKQAKALAKFHKEKALIEKARAPQGNEVIDFGKRRGQKTG